MSSSAPSGMGGGDEGGVAPSGANVADRLGRGCCCGGCEGRSSVPRQPKAAPKEKGQGEEGKGEGEWEYDRIDEHEVQRR